MAEDKNEPAMDGRGLSNRSLMDELESIAEHCAGLPLGDERSADEILGYRDDGLPG